MEVESLNGSAFFDPIHSKSPGIEVREERRDPNGFVELYKGGVVNENIFGRIYLPPCC